MSKGLYNDLKHESCPQAADDFHAHCHINAYANEITYGLSPSTFITLSFF